MPNTTATLPTDIRARQGGILFIGSLVIFFLSSILLYVLYAISRRDDPFSDAPLPAAFLLSTLCLIVISLLLHLASRWVRRDRITLSALILGISTVLAITFLGLQIVSMHALLEQTAGNAQNGRGVVGMVVVLAFLHALHVAGGVIALGVVTVRSAQGRYDHERHFAVDFSAQYWHFLDLVWVVMLVAFWMTTGGFSA